ncbi:MAG: permease [Pseudomonadota bacterium]
MSLGKRKDAEPDPGQKHHPRHVGWWFLLAVLMLHLGVRMIDPTVSLESLGYFVGVVTRLLPALGVMFLLLWLFNLFASPQQITRSLGQQSGLKGWIFTIVGGVVSMGSVYLWYPLLRDLKTHGMRTTLIATFLYSRAVKIPLLPLMMHYFGTLYTILFVLNVLLFSIASGLVMERIDVGMTKDSDKNSR